MIQLVHSVHPLATAKGTERAARPTISPAPITAAATEVNVVDGSSPSSNVSHRANSGQPMNSAAAILRLNSRIANKAAAIVTIAPTGGVICSRARVRTTATDRLSAALITVAAHGLTVNKASESARKATAASVISRWPLSTQPAATPKAAASTKGASNQPSADHACRPDARPNPSPAAMSAAEVISQ
jgi:hypothetical protein